MRYYVLKFWGFILSLFHMQRIMVWDMDGCLVNIYEFPDYMDNLENQHFFLNASPYYQTILALNKFMKKHPDCKVAICSKIMPTAYCEVEKNVWANMFTPEIKLRMFVQQYENKSDYIKKHCKSKRIYFFDDYTFNAKEMLESGICKKVTKVKNQINCKKGEWTGLILDTNTEDTNKIVCGMEMIVYDKTF